MPKGRLTREKRLEQSVRRLKNISAKQRATIASLKKDILTLKQQIAGLEEKLQDKEVQRRQLLSYLYKENKPKGIRYVISESRGKGIPEEALGDKNKDRVIISDGYMVYDKLKGEKQQCWVHLLRVAKLASHPLYQDLVQLYLLLGNELTKKLKQRDPPSFQRKLQDIIQKNYSDLGAKKVQERIEHHQNQLLTCLEYKDILPENNTAERALRNHVVMRKIFGGSRSIDGARAHEVNSSIIETMLQQNPNSSFFNVMLPLIQKRREESWDERRGFTRNCE